MDILKVADTISKKQNLKISEIRWYASLPSEKKKKFVYQNQRKFLANLEKSGVKVFTRKLQRISTESSNRKKKAIIESSICSRCKPVVEKNFLSLEGYAYREKGIDVDIAINMIKSSIKEDVDMVVLISGDADFIPAFELIKESGKEVLSCYFPRGYSSELRQKFPHLILEREDLADCLRKRRREK